MRVTALNGMNRQGGLAERLVVPAPFAWPIARLDPDGPGLRRADTASPPFDALARGAILALVIGAGAQGLLMWLASRSAESAWRYPTSTPIDWPSPSTTVRIRSVANKIGEFELVVDTVGSPASAETAMTSVAVGGTLLIIGLDSRPMGLTAQAIVRRQLLIRGSLTYDHPDDFRASVAAFSERRLTPGEIVAHEYPLEDAQAAFEEGSSAAGKSWIRVAPSRENP